jgi:DNA primase
VPGARRATGSGRRGRLDDADFRRLVDEAKAKRNLSDILGRHTKLRKRGREVVGLCPFHQEKSPSFEVNDAKGVFYCHGCGAAGDHITALRLLDGMDWGGAYEALNGDRFPTVDPADRAKALAEDRKARAESIADARFMWEKCLPIRGTRGERYLRETRGITMDLPPCVRFGMVPTSRDDNGNWKRPLPAVVFAVTDGAGAIVGLQRVFLTDDGRQKRWGKRSKLSLGRPRGAAVRLRDGGDVIICEGPEDGLSLAQELPDRAVWVALGTAMMPEIEIPTSLRVVTIAGQNDKPGRAAVEKARERFQELGVTARLMFPADGFKDWNDQLRGVRS